MWIGKIRIQNGRLEKPVMSYILKCGTLSMLIETLVRVKLRSFWISSKVFLPMNLLVSRVGRTSWKLYHKLVFSFLAYFYFKQPILANLGLWLHDVNGTKIRYNLGKTNRRDKLAPFHMNGLLTHMHISHM